MRADSDLEHSDPLPILDYRARAAKPTSRQRLASAMGVLGVLAAMAGAFAVLLTIELLFLMLVDLCTIRRLQQGESIYLAGSLAASMAMIGFSILAHRVAQMIVKN